ncbi:MAG: TlpA disulfide reductase family protein [Chthoniobacterales bacterium]
MKLKSIVPLLFFVGLAFSAWPLTASGAEKKEPRSAPNWELKDVEGKPVKLSDYKGKVILLNFWATWCPPCRDEIPDLIALQQRYAPQGLVVIGMSVDRGGAEMVRRFATKMGINYPVVMADQKTAASYGDFSAIPTSFFINRKGEIVGERGGAADEATFEAEITPLLANSPSGR